MPLSTALDQMQARADWHGEWLKENCPCVVADQKHLDVDTPELAYWHYGYRAALLDAIKLIRRETVTGRATMSFEADDGPYWKISGPRKSVNIPMFSPDHWCAEMTFGAFPGYKTVVAWGPTEEAAKAEAVRKSKEA